MTWKPFFLQPHLPPEGIDKREAAIKRMGEDRVGPVLERVIRMAECEGICYSPGGRAGGSRNAHRLMKLAQERDAETGGKVMEGLFQAYHEHEKNLADMEVLEKAAVEAGMARDQVMAFLKSDKYGSEVDAEAQSARGAGINGVPHFLLQGKHVIDGAQDPSDFLMMFQEIKEEEGR